MLDEVPAMGRVALPWIRGVRFSANESRVLWGSDPIFTQFTTASFVSALLRSESLGLLEKTVCEQTPDSIDVIEYIIVNLLTGDVPNDEVNNRLQHVITFLYALKPRHVLSLVLEILSFDFRHYDEIQINRRDSLLFDADAFLAGLQSQKALSSKKANRASMLDSVSGSPYHRIVDFVLSVIGLCFRQNSEPFDDFVARIVLFLYLRHEEFPQRSAELCGLFRVDLNHAADIRRTVSAATKDKLVVQALAWALCCDALEMAVRALDFLTIVGPSISEPIGAALFRTVYIVSRALFERSHTKAVASSLWMGRPSSTDLKSFATVQYLSRIIQFLALAPPSIEHFWLGIALLGTGKPEFVPVFNAALGLVAAMLSSAVMLPFIAESTVSRNFPGILPLLADATFDADTPPMLTKLIEAILIPQARVIGFASNPDTEAFTSLLNLCRGGAVRLECLPLAELELCLAVTAQLILVSKRAGPMFDACAKASLQKVSHTVLGKLGRAVVQMSSSEKSADLLLCQISQTGAPIATQTKNDPFPEILIDRQFDFADLGPASSLSLFDDVRRFPPLFIADPAFMRCPIVQQIRTVIERVEAQPFTRWSELMFESQSLVLAKAVDNKNVVVERLSSSFFTQLIQGMRVSPLTSSGKLSRELKSTKSLASQMSMILQSPVVDAKEENRLLYSVDVEMFLENVDIEDLAKTLLSM
jgi:hypothetical protein